MRFGMIALTDCSPIVIAHEKGLFKKYGINSTVEQGRELGRHPRLALERRHPGDAHADRHADRLDDGPARLAEEADGHPLDAQPQRPVDHAEGRRSRARSQADPKALKPLADEAQGEGHAADVRDDLPARNARDVDALLAGRRRHQPRQGRRAHHHPAAADGRQHEGRQDGRLLRRRALERARDRRRHRLHRHQHPGHLEGPPGEGLRVHRGVRRQEPEDGQGGAQGAARGERLARRHEEPPGAGGDRLARHLHQLSARS